MGNLVIPKHEGRIEVIMEAMKIYYEKKDQWVTNEELKSKLKLALRTNEGGDAYTKKGQVAAYFGFIEWKDIDDEESDRRITDIGKEFYESYLKKDPDKCIKILIYSLQSTMFGRNNYGCPDSDSDLEVPNVLVKVIMDTGYITNVEFGNMLYYINEKGFTYEKSLKYILKIRNSRDVLSTDMLHSDWKDPKPILALERYGLLKSDKKHKRSKVYEIPNQIRDKYYFELKNIEIYNNETRNIMSNIDSDLLQDNIDDLEGLFNEEIDNVDILTEKEKDKINNRKPEIYSSRKIKRYKTNARVKKTAICECEYKCFNNNEHILFKKKDGTNYLEGHHIIPMAAQYEFGDINLDRTENIVALCPHCHKAIHHGDENTIKSVLGNIFEVRKELLKQVGISIDIDILYKKYYK